MRTQRSVDLVSGSALALLGLVVLAASMQIKGGMGTLPYLTGFSVLVGGLAVAFQAYRYHGPVMEVSWPDRSGMWRNIITMVMLAAYVGLLEVLGTPLATVLFVFGLIWYLRGGQPVSSLLIGLACGVTIHFLFIQALELSLPLGILFY